MCPYLCLPAYSLRPCPAVHFNFSCKNVSNRISIKYFKVESQS